MLRRPVASGWHIRRSYEAADISTFLSLRWNDLGAYNKTIGVVTFVVGAMSHVQVRFTTSRPIESGPVIRLRLVPFSHCFIFSSSFSAAGPPTSLPTCPCSYVRRTLIWRGILLLPRQALCYLFIKRSNYECTKFKYARAVRNLGDVLR